jgi:hypothetical protein
MGLANFVCFADIVTTAAGFFTASTSPFAIVKCDYLLLNSVGWKGHKVIAILLPFANELNAVTMYFVVP